MGYEVTVEQGENEVKFYVDTDYDAIEIAEKMWDGIREYGKPCSVKIASLPEEQQ